MDYKVETIENQQKFILPLTRETECLFYNQRMIIDNKVLTEPLAWRITKVNRVSQGGVTKITLAQDKFDQNKDYIELDSNGNVIGMWADYYSQGQVTPDEPVEENADIYSIITYSGVKPEIKINGSYKKFTVTFYNQEGQIDYQSGDWNYDIRDGEIITPISDISGILDISTSGLSDNQIKVKFVGDDSYLNKVLIINHTAVVNGNNIVSHLEVEITSL